MTQGDINLDAERGWPVVWRDESREEYIRFPFESWKRLEQLQDYLRLLTDTNIDKVKDDTAVMILERIRFHGPS